MAAAATTSITTPNGFKYMLPESFRPSEYDFVIGRGKKIKQHSGNQRLYTAIRTIADDYTAADKARKSYLLSQLVQQVYDKSPEAGFVKKDPATGRWYAVEDALARTSAAQAVRDCLHTAYKSSRQFKQQRRRKAKQQPQPQFDNNDLLLVDPPSFERTVTPDESFFYHQTNTTTKPTSPSCNNTSSSNGIFSILATNFAAATASATGITLSEDPFAPIPLPPSSKSEGRTVLEIFDDAVAILDDEALLCRLEIEEEGDELPPLPLDSLIGSLPEDDDSCLDDIF